MKSQFEKLDCEYEQDVKYLESVGDSPSDEAWEACMKVWRRTWDRLFALAYIEGGARNRN